MFKYKVRIDSIDRRPCGHIRLHTLYNPYYNKEFCVIPDEVSFLFLLDTTDARFARAI